MSEEERKNRSEKQSERFVLREERICGSSEVRDRRRRRRRRIHWNWWKWNEEKKNGEEGSRVVL